MPQRSFRLSDASLADLDRIARHLSAIDGRPPNQTTALAWAVARGADAVDAAEAKAKPSGSALTARLRQIQQQLSDITKALSDDARTRAEERTELEKHRRRLPLLEKLVAQPDAAGRWSEVDNEGRVWTCEGSPQNYTRTADIRVISYSDGPLPPRSEAAAQRSGAPESHAEVARRSLAAYDAPRAGDGDRE